MIVEGLALDEGAQGDRAADHSFSINSAWKINCAVLTWHPSSYAFDTSKMGHSVHFDIIFHNKK